MTKIVIGSDPLSRAWGLLLFVLCLLPRAATAQDTTGVGSIAGTIVDGANQAVPFATVCVVGTSRCEVTGPSGAFRLGDMRTGYYQLEISAPGQPAIVSGQIEVRAGIEQRVEVSLPRADALAESVTVTASADRAPEDVRTSAYLITPSAIFKSAGALQDVSRYVQSLPGVVIGSDDFRNDIIVRGGSPLENLFVVDNVEVPNINTFANFASAGGTVSILDVAMIRDVTFLTGGYPAPFTNRLSSVLQIAQREGDRAQFRGRATLGFAGAGTVLEGPIARGRGSWIVSARRSFLDLFTSDVGIGGVPVLYTLNAKAVYDVGPRDRLWAVSISGADRIRLGLTDEIEPDEEISSFDIRYNGWRSATGFNWQRIFGERGVGLLGVTHSRAVVASRVKDLVRDGVPPAGVPADVVIAASPVVFSEDSSEDETTVKYDLTVGFRGLGKLQTGGSLKVFQSAYDSASPLGDDSPYSLTAGLNPFSITTRLVASQTGAYAQFTPEIGARLNLTLGGRVDHYQFLGRTRFSPRAGVSYGLTRGLQISGSYGAYFQQPLFLFLAAFPENRSLVPPRADHLVAGLAWTASASTRIGVEAYRKDYRHYPVALQFPSLSLANLGDTFNVREILFPLISAGKGHAHGVEFFGERKSTEGWYGQANLAFSRTRHAGLDMALRPGSFDYPIVMNVTGGWRVNSRWEVGMRLAALAGRPYTPFDEAASIQQRRGIFDLSRVNAERAPAYARLDLRIDRIFRVQGRSVVAFAGVQNVTNRRNFAQYTWNRRSNRADFTEQLGVFPLVGLEWRF